ncbi:MAG TPA: hypothetical protein VE007_12725 [Thermoanaerobaculia bacterium]|nr:hypothetical protein [Thermoanaerobaculia bacterium]
MRKIRISSLALVLLGGAFVSIAQQAAPDAAPSGPQMTLGISPLRVELKVTPGAETSQSVKISNSGQLATQVRVSVTDWTLSESGDQSFVKPGGSSWGCAKWVRVNPSEFALPPAGTSLVRYTMRVPEDAPQGGFHCAILFETLPPPREQLSAGTGVINLLRLVTTIYATIGNPPVLAKIERLELAPSKSPAKNALEVVTGFSNGGTTQYRVSGELQVLDGDGKAVRKFEYKSFPVLPGVSRKAVFPIDPPLPPGQYLLRALIDTGGKERLSAETRVRVSGG